MTGMLLYMHIIFFQHTRNWWQMFFPLMYFWLIHGLLQCSFSPLLPNSSPMAYSIGHSSLAEFKVVLGSQQPKNPGPVLTIRPTTGLVHCSLSYLYFWSSSLVNCFSITRKGNLKVRSHTAPFLAFSLHPEWVLAISWDIFCIISPNWSQVAFPKIQVVITLRKKQ